MSLAAILARGLRLARLPAAARSPSAEPLAWRGPSAATLTALGLAVVLGAGCAQLPRTAAVQGQILRDAQAETRDFAVVPVTREALSTLGGWPAPATVTRHPWLPRTAGSTSLVIRPGDRINLTVWDNDPNSLLTGTDQKSVAIGNLPVSPGGTIFVPYLDEIVVSGLTPEAARERIQHGLADIMTSAQVQLDVAPGRGSSVDLVGGVNAPGSYPLPDRNFTLLNLISAGGGVRAGLNNPQLRLARGARVYGIALRRLMEDPGLDTVLMGGDKITIEPDPRSFIALGAAGTQNIIDFDRDEISALQAVSMIGGVSAARGDPRGILLLREYPDRAIDPEGRRGPDRGRVVFTFDLTTADGLFSARHFPLAPDDLVLVTEAPLGSAGASIGLLNQLLSSANLVTRLN